ncbi:MAG TPA: hypothetical protein VKB91_06575 [Gemmatimonadaceae bacterium]|nr:hypothetical protein [Gemmatimonadaceae bacterium]
MRRIALACVILALATPSRAFAQLATTKFYNFVDTPVAVTFGSNGQAQIKLTPTAAVISVTGYRRVSVIVGSTHATNLRIQMGKIAGATLSTSLYNGPVNQQVHTYEVIGPELVLVLTGAPANSTDHVQVWVYLTT